MHPPKDSGGLGKRLDSWKEIAAYLNRDTRTVQRWEKSEGLPVHRHVHEAQASVYAYTADLDAWRQSRKRAAQLNPLASSVVPPLEVVSQRRSVSAKKLAVAAGLVLAVGAGFAEWRRLHQPQLLPLHEKEWVLVEGFENRTGEPLLDGALRDALELELNNSTFVYVIPKERIEDTLRLMRKPADTKLDLSLAREVCLRDAAIRALVAGRTEKYGDTYVFSVELIDPVRNVPVALHSESAPNREQMWSAVRKLSNWVRESLGEAMDHIDHSNQELEKVTTPSLHAFQLFSEADRANKHAQWRVSAQLLREAVAEDPDFASAHTWLAWDLKNLNDPGWQQEIRRAMALSDKVSERERYFIKGSYYLLHGQPENAIPVLEALLRRYPDHYFGNANLASAYSETGRSQAAQKALVRQADLRPNYYVTNALAAGALMPFDVEQASKYAQRARALAEVEAPDRPGPIDVEVMLSRFDELWAREDIPGAFAELKRQLQHPKPGAWPGAIAVRYFRLGRYNDAIAMIQQDPDYPSKPRSQANFLFRLAMYSGKDEQARGILRDILQSDPNRLLGYAFPAWQLGFSGWENSLSSAAPVADPRLLAQGTLALRDGRYGAAVKLLQTAWDQHHNEMIYGPWMAEGLSIAFERLGDLPQATQALEHSSTERLQNPPEWLRNEARLSSLYRQLHRDAAARQIEDRLRKLLAFADVDHPILKELSRR